MTPATRRLSLSRRDMFPSDAGGGADAGPGCQRGWPQQPLTNAPNQLTHKLTHWRHLKLQGERLQPNSWFSPIYVSKVLQKAPTAPNYSGWWGSDKGQQRWKQSTIAAKTNGSTVWKQTWLLSAERRIRGYEQRIGNANSPEPEDGTMFPDLWTSSNLLKITFNLQQETERKIAWVKWGEKNT